MGPRGAYTSFDTWVLKISGSTQGSGTWQSWSPKSGFVFVFVFFWLASVLYQECLHECWEDGNIPTLSFRFYLSIFIPLQPGSFKSSLTLDDSSSHSIGLLSSQLTQLLPHTMHIWMAGCHRISSEVYPFPWEFWQEDTREEEILDFDIIIIIIMVSNIYWSFTLCQELFYKLCMN